MNYHRNPTASWQTDVKASIILKRTTKRQLHRQGGKAMTHNWLFFLARVWGL
jgi:hypothetical protein